MKNNTETKIWNATLYLRLSRDDGDKEESNSITGQRELLRDFIQNRPELREYAVRIDDGFTGSNFERPDFKKMMEDVKEGRTNCIIVKDLSRFGRNYLDAGEYIEKIFPFLGVRFIAVNDNYDSLGEKSASDDLVIPFKNLINEAYCRDISVKVRTQLEIKRKSGQYIAVKLYRSLLQCFPKSPPHFAADFFGFFRIVWSESDKYLLHCYTALGIFK